MFSKQRLIKNYPKILPTPLILYQISLPEKAFLSINTRSGSISFSKCDFVTFWGIFPSRYYFFPAGADEQELATPILSLVTAFLQTDLFLVHPFLLWKRGESGPVTQWRQLVSCDWLWHSHGRLIQSRFDLKINRSINRPHRNIVELHAPAHRLLFPVNRESPKWWVKVKLLIPRAHMSGFLNWLFLLSKLVGNRPVLQVFGSFDNFSQSFQVVNSYDKKKVQCRSLDYSVAL